MSHLLSDTPLTYGNSSSKDTSNVQSVSFSSAPGLSSSSSSASSFAGGAISSLHCVASPSRGSKRDRSLVSSSASSSHSGTVGQIAEIGSPVSKGFTCADASNS